MKAEGEHSEFPAREDGEWMRIEGAKRERGRKLAEEDRGALEDVGHDGGEEGIPQSTSSHGGGEDGSQRGGHRGEAEEAKHFEN